MLSHLRYPKKTIDLKLRFYEEDVNLTRYPWELLFNRQHLLLNGAVNLTRYISYSREQNISFRIKDLKKVIYIESRPFDLDILPGNERTVVYDVLKSLENVIICIHQIKGEHPCLLTTPSHSSHLSEFWGRRRQGFVQPLSDHYRKCDNRREIITAHV
jgi:hypothetical protein